MKLDELYRKAILVGISKDLRDKKEIESLLREEKKKFNELKKEEKEFFDQDRLFNPYADTRILNGNRNIEVKKVIVGIDIEVGEILLAHFLNETKKEKIDCIISHHPEGFALAQLYDVMKLQADILASFGITLSVAEQLMEKRISEIERRLLPINHNRTIDAASILGIPLICIHTPADNCVTHFLSHLFKKEKPNTLQDLIGLLKNIPEYKKASRLQTPPKIVSGQASNKCGKIYVDMTGGTEGSKEIFQQYAAQGISTLVGMHYSEEHLENAKKAHLNVVIAGHIASDVLGLNLLFDEIEKEEPLEFVSISGFERIRKRSP